MTVLGMNDVSYVRAGMRSTAIPDHAMQQLTLHGVNALVCTDGRVDVRSPGGAWVAVERSAWPML